MKRYRILFEGERWLGSNSASCVRALRRLGHLILESDPATYIPWSWEGIFLRGLKKTILNKIVKEYNQALLKAVSEFNPHIFIAFKGQFVHPETLKIMKAKGISLYNYYPDLSVILHGELLPFTFREYNCIFSTKKFMGDDLTHLGCQVENIVYLPHGYDPELHRPLKVGEEEKKLFGSEVVFIGAYTPKKAEILSKLKRNVMTLDLGIWGNGWERSSYPELEPSLKYKKLLGDAYPLTLCASKIALGLLLEKVKGASKGDQVTSRTFNIPATGTFMIHQRTEEVLEFFEEGKEIECFDSPEELADKVKYYLKHEEKRKKIAEAGYRRCVPAYSHDNRMKEIIKWHEAHR